MKQKTIKQMMTEMLVAANNGGDESLRDYIADNIRYCFYRFMVEELYNSFVSGKSAYVVLKEMAMELRTFYKDFMARAIDRYLAAPAPKNKKSRIATALMAAALLVGISTACAQPTDSVQVDSLYWKERALKADAIIDSIFRHVGDSYIDDVLMETELWDDYCILIEQSEK